MAEPANNIIQFPNWGLTERYISACYLSCIAIVLPKRYPPELAEDIVNGTFEDDFNDWQDADFLRWCDSMDLRWGKQWFKDCYEDCGNAITGVAKSFAEKLEGGPIDE
jgi:hypothetical protein